VVLKRGEDMTLKKKNYMNLRKKRSNLGWVEEHKIIEWGI
jgi:hypothetical protein